LISPRRNFRIYRLHHKSEITHLLTIIANSRMIKVSQINSLDNQTTFSKINLTNVIIITLTILTLIDRTNKSTPKTKGNDKTNSLSNKRTNPTKNFTKVVTSINLPSHHLCRQSLLIYTRPNITTKISYSSNNKFR